MLQEILKQQEEELEDWIERTNDIEAFITVANEEELDKFKNFIQS